MMSLTRERVRAFFFHAWPSKLLSLLAAVLVWWFATVGDTPVTQASRVVPLEIQGLGTASVASGVPESAILTIRGPSVLIERMPSQSLGAIIDLSGQTGEFEAEITVLIPQGVELVDVSPGSVIGSVQVLQDSLVPVEAIIIGPESGDSRVTVTLEPAEATVSGVDPVLSRVARVLVPVRASAGERSQPGFAADLDGHPVSDVRVQPQTFGISVSELPLLEQTTVTIELLPPAVSGFNVTARLEASEHTVIGPPSAIEGLETVRGTIRDLDTPDEAGSWTVPVVLELPEGVAPSGQPTAVLRLTAPELEE